MVVAWRHWGLPFFAGDLVGSSPISRIVELQLLVFVVSLETAWFWGLRCGTRALFKTIEFVNGSQGEFVQFFHFLMLWADGLKSVGFLVIVWFIYSG